MPKRMFQIEDKCKKCGLNLYITRLQNRRWCRKCRVYVDSLTVETKRFDPKTGQGLKFKTGGAEHGQKN